MNFTQFKNRFQHHPVILSKDAVRLEKSSQAIRNQLKRWQGRGLIIKLKRGMYLLNQNDRKVNPSLNFIANQLYGPSYVSLEYAMSFYGLIPEKVSDVTSVTTKKTVRFKNAVGLFVYQHIKPETFRGFKKIDEESGFSVFIAEPEKAIVDFLYLNLYRFTRCDVGMFKDSCRFQNTEGLSQRKVADFARLFGNRKLAKVARCFCAFIKKEAK